MFIIKRLAAVLSVLACLVSGQALAATIHIAHNDGTVSFLPTNYTNGFGTVGSANYIASNLSAFDTLGNDVIIKVTMGSFVDYFKPITGQTLLGMLTSKSMHLWSATATGSYVAPTYSSAGFGLGGSGFLWPASNVLGDSRSYLSFWGVTVTGVVLGGCCVGSSTDDLAWGRAFTMDLITPTVVPVPAAGWLIIAGFGSLAALRRRRSPRR